MEYKPLTFYHFFTDLIFCPKHAEPAERTKCVVISVMLAVFSLGIIPVVVGTGWAINRMIVWIRENLSSQDKKAQTIAKKEGILSNSKFSAEDVVDTLQKRGVPKEAERVMEINCTHPLRDLPQIYKNERAFIRQNLEKLLTMDALNASHFIGIRGDGDCAFRAIAIGFILKSACECQPININGVFEKIESKKEDIPEEMWDEFLKNYHTLNGLLSALNKKRETENNPLSTVIDACLGESFTIAFNTFLRKASALEIMTNQTLKNEEVIFLLGINVTSDVDEHLKEKFWETSPNNAQFFGSIQDCKALSHLLDVPISWLYVNDSAVQPPSVVCCLPTYELKNNSCEGIIILNRGPHCDLILTSK
jgi:hypothetical protein